jgi:glycosyltransferase 2 family protein
VKKKLFSGFVSAFIVYALYKYIHVDGMLAAIYEAKISLLIGAAFMLLPQYLVQSFRFQLLTVLHRRIPYKDLFGMVAVANALNLILPSKMGDLMKGVFLKDKYAFKVRHSLSIVVYEKILDFLGILMAVSLGFFWLKMPSDFVKTIFSMSLVGTVFFILFLSFPALSNRCLSLFSRVLGKKISEKILLFKEGWADLQTQIVNRPFLFFKLLSLSFLNSAIQFLQLWFLVLSLGQWVSHMESFALTGIGVLAGLIPFTFSGVGTRDAMLVFLYGPIMGYETASAFGVLCTARCIFPAVVGLPLIGRYFSDFKVSKHSQKQ